jgi:putative spermidine/putrescine transport system ATP-binding protein
MMSDNFIEFKGVQKSYDGKNLVIPNLDLSIRQGEFLTLLGASGSGKTTTLMMLAGFEVPTKGEILINGQPIQNVPPQKRGIGMVFQNYALFPHMTIEENLAYPLQMRRLGRSEVEEKVSAAIKMVHLEDMQKRKPSQLSGGQQQRVALARALVFEPELVLMDEPLGALDKNLREHMQYEIKQLHKELGVTVVYVTHDQSEALTMSDRVAVFKDGRIEQMAPPSQIYDAPHSAYIAGFIGENNFLKGTVRQSENVSNPLLQIDTNLSIPLGGTSWRGKVSDNNQKVTIALRPEHVSIQTPSKSDEIKLPCTVLDKVYLGDHTRLLCNLIDGTPIVAKVVDTEASSLLATGDKIELGFCPEDIIVFSTEAA